MPNELAFPIRDSSHLRPWATKGTIAISVMSNLNPGSAYNRTTVSSRLWLEDPAVIPTSPSILRERHTAQAWDSEAERMS